MQCFDSSRSQERHKIHAAFMTNSITSDGRMSAFSSEADPLAPLIPGLPLTPERTFDANSSLRLTKPAKPPPMAVTSVGLRVAKKARKSKAPIPNIKRLRICFILAPMHFPVRTEALQLKRQLAFRGQADSRESYPLRAPAP